MTRYKVIVADETGEYKLSGADTVFPGTNGLKQADKKNLNISIKKFLARSLSFKPESQIMNYAVDEVLNGNYVEAEILFEQVKDNITDGSVENNLGVIFELTKRKKKAHIMYINAVIKSPQNLKFRSNLLSFIDQYKFTQENKTESDTVK